jgi:hypothetical protein
MQSGPLRAGERPFVLRALRELLAGAADVEQHRRLPVPAGVLALEEMSEEALLQADTVIGVEMREMGVAVHLQPLLLAVGG